MPRTSKTSLSASPLLLLGFVVLLCIFPAIAFASVSISQESPAAESDLICHTSDPKECYPRIFQPTDEFQKVHDDQELPPGLHVRLNMATGQKEAKINVPGENDPALEGLPVERDIVLVEPQEPDEPKIPEGAPEYDNVGKIKGPQKDAEEFVEAMDMLRTGQLGSNELLESLEDIAHDIYYGSKIAEDPAVLKALFCMLADDGAGAPEGVTPRDQQAGAILAAALQNNPAALKEVVKSWPELMSSKCQGEKVPLSQAFYTPLVNPDLNKDAATAASSASAKIGAINGLIKDDGIRAEFLENGGMDHLLAVLVPEDKAWASAQRKAGQLALDNFLDEDMGARLGQWPLAQRPSNQKCSGTGSETNEGCWDYHVERIMKANEGDKDHWSKDLHDRLAALGRKEGVVPHNEL